MIRGGTTIHERCMDFAVFNGVQSREERCANDFVIRGELGNAAGSGKSEGFHAVGIARSIILPGKIVNSIEGSFEGPGAGTWSVACFHDHVRDLVLLSKIEGDVDLFE